MEDIEIARNAKLENITKIAEKLNLSEDEIDCYGKYKAKIKVNKSKNKKGKLILVTSINPTPLGEGKTTMAIGLVDGMRKIGKNALAVLREPSMGPVFGIKGGATGGGHAQIAPMEDINLHFNGDFHAITSANNLLASMIDNHIYFGNELDIKKVLWKRCLDVNDRALRKIQIGLSGEKNLIPREDGFSITAASEIMAIFCLAKDLSDLEKRLGDIIIGYNSKEQPVFARDIKAEGALTVLLKEAINPNLVQTLEGAPVIVHGGPFANIAHGCNSIIATNMGLSLGDYVVTEAGFGADLGLEKFMNIKTRELGRGPDTVVCVATIKALKYHGGMPIEDLTKESIEYLSKGYKNLKKHIQNIKSFGVNAVVAINRYLQDTNKEIEFLRDELKKEGVELSLVEAWAKGGDGATDLAEKVVKLCDKPYNLNYTYDLNVSIEEKIRKVAQNIYGAKDIELSNEAKESIKIIEKMGYGNWPVCIAKTQYSLSDDANNLECNEPFTIKIRDVEVKAGAKFIVVLAGNIFTMPGLSKVPSAEKIHLNSNGDIVGIF